MLKIAAELPPGVLVGGESALVAQSVLRAGGARFLARDADLTREGGAITAWQESLGGGAALAATPNTGHSRFDPGPPPAVLCESGVNCGFRIADFGRGVEQFTMAVIYGSAGEARTLAAVTTGQANNVIFISESAGRLVMKDRANSVEAVLPMAAQSGPRLVIASYDGRTIRLRADGREARAQGRVPDMNSPADFLIGCRSNRPGLTKMLGQSRLHEVMFWPDRALDEATSPEDAAVIAALDRHLRWSF